MEHYFDNYKRQLSLLLDRNRTLKYKYAIFKAVKPDDIVIDFGCGTGILGFFALQAGARHVYAIEETSIIDYAKQLANKNKFTDKITFINKSGHELTKQDIPQQVDIILSEPISNLLLEGNAWSAIEHLKSFLKDGGLILPAAGTLFMVPVNSAPRTFYDSEFFIGEKNVYNLDFMELPRHVFYKSTFDETAWLSKPQPLLQFNLLSDTLSDTFRNSVKFSIQQSGQLFGVEFFMNVQIFGNITLSSRDQQEYPSWSPLFAPSSFNPYICRGDLLRITVWNKVLSPYKCEWNLEFTHHSKLLLFNDTWWRAESAIPTLAPGVILSDNGLLFLHRDEFSQYDCDTELEWDFIQLFPKKLNCNEICQTILQSEKYSLSHEELMDNLIQLLHKLLINSLIDLPIPSERFQVTNFHSKIYIP
ncbi:MAG: 50S ribosomal protein L11 methyltransferase [Candidatus Helarchaeota archaeon]